MDEIIKIWQKNNFKSLFVLFFLFYTSNVQASTSLQDLKPVSLFVLFAVFFITPYLFYLLNSLILLIRSIFGKAIKSKLLKRLRWLTWINLILVFCFLIIEYILYKNIEISISFAILYLIPLIFYVLGILINRELKTIPSLSFLKKIGLFCLSSLVIFFISDSFIQKNKQSKRKINDKVHENEIKLEQIKNLDIELQTEELEAYNRIIKLNKSVGLITLGTHPKDLDSLYPGSSTKTKVLYSYEGIDVMGTELCFVTPTDNLDILWYDKVQTPARISITNRKASWKLENGITMLSTLEEIEAANGKPFIMYGYEIDKYLEGTVKSWEGGNLEGLELQFTAPKNTQYLIGDRIMSTNPKLLQQDLKLSKITIPFEYE